MSNPITVANGTYAAQVAFPFDTPLVQRFQIGLAQTAIYIINTEDPATTSHADRALMARYVASDPAFWAQRFAWAISVDTAILDSCTDQTISDRIWVLWPVFSYQASTVPVIPTPP